MPVERTVGHFPFAEVAVILNVFKHENRMSGLGNCGHVSWDLK